jgi:hypothetical protein
MRSANRKDNLAQATESRRSPRVVYTQPPVVLAKLLGREGRGWRVRLAGAEHIASCDDSVDPALLDEAARCGSRVVIETSEDGPTIVGTLTTSRAVRIDGEGAVDVKLKSFRVTVEDEVLLRTEGAFARVSGGQIELYGQQILTRAREIARILARMIKLN